MFVLLARERLSSLEPMSWDRDAVNRGCLLWGWQTPTVAPVFPGTLNVDVFLSLCERRADDVMPLFPFSQQRSKNRKLTFSNADGRPGVER